MSVHSLLIGDWWRYIVLWRLSQGYKNKKTAKLSLTVILSFFVRRVILNYFAESAAAESVATVSTESTVVVSTESVDSVLAFVLPPQDAKEIAAIATNIKTNFFIFFAF